MQEPLHHQIEGAACARRWTARAAFSHLVLNVLLMSHHHMSHVTSSGLERLVDLALNFTHHEFTRRP
jgi:hypothetical protein